MYTNRRKSEDYPRQKVELYIPLMLLSISKLKSIQHCTKYWAATIRIKTLDRSIIVRLVCRRFPMTLIMSTFKFKLSFCTEAWGDADLEQMRVTPYVHVYTSLGVDQLSDFLDKNNERFKGTRAFR